MTGEECRFVARTRVLFSPLTLEGGSRSRVAAARGWLTLECGRRNRHVVGTTLSAGRGAGYFFFARCFEIS